MRGARILLLGMGYKRAVGDTRGSPSLRIMELLESKGAKVCYHDPYVPQVWWRGRAMASVPLSAEVLSCQDCVVLVTDHEYDVELVLGASRLVIDTRNAIKRKAPNCMCMWGRNGNHGPAGAGPREDGWSPGASAGGGRAAAEPGSPLSWGGPGKRVGESGASGFPVGGQEKGEGEA